jgi:hypothetical protein
MMSAILEAVTAGAEQIAAQVRQVANLRRREGELNTKIAEAKAAFWESIRYLTEEAKQLGSECASAEAMLKANTLAHYQQTGETKPTAGVQVKLYTHPVYDQDQADKWTREHRVARIPEEIIPERFDRRAFEKIAKVTPIDFVVMKEEPKVTIATDLQKVLNNTAH